VRTRPAIRFPLSLPLACFLLTPASLLAFELRFGPEEFVQAGGSDLAVAGYSVPSFVHWDGDGLPDLIVGEGSGLEAGKVRVYLNGGTPTAPQFDSFTYAQSLGADLIRTGGG
jgi:hypothetical protein